MYLKSSLRPLLTRRRNTQRKLQFKSLEIIVIIALTFLLLLGIPGKSDIYALPSGGHSLGGGIGGAGGIGGGGPISGNQPNSIGWGHRSGPNPTTNCIGSADLFPSSTNCASPTVLHPTNTPNTTVVQPSNCNVPTSVHHTDAPSTVVVHPSNCPPSSGSSNSLTVNNVQSSSSSGGSTTSQTTMTPVANAGSNQNVHSSVQVTLDGTKSYDPNGHSLTFTWLQLAGGPVVVLSSDNKAKLTFTAPLVRNTTNLTFHLIVNNGNADSNPSYESVTVTP